MLFILGLVVVSMIAGLIGGGIGALFGAAQDGTKLREAKQQVEREEANQVEPVTGETKETSTSNLETIVRGQFLVGVLLVGFSYQLNNFFLPTPIPLITLVFGMGLVIRGLHFLQWKCRSGVGLFGLVLLICQLICFFFFTPDGYFSDLWQSITSLKF
ncbi:hypothetical protein N8529_00780 [bacterium]|nr:hypothetical protein [bacterium]